MAGAAIMGDVFEMQRLEDADYVGDVTKLYDPAHPDVLEWNDYERVIVKKDALNVTKKKMKAKMGTRLSFFRVVLLMLYMLVLWMQSFPDDQAWITHPLYQRWGGIYELEKIEDWFDYSKDVLADVLINKYYNGDDIDDPLGHNMVLDHNKLFSPIYISRTSSANDTCDGIGDVYYESCYDDVFPISAVFSAFNRIQVDYSQSVDLTINNSTFTTNPDRDFILISARLEEKEDALNLIDHLRESRWIDRSTNGLRIAFVLYNGNENIFARIDIYLQRRTSGFLIPDIVISPAKLEIYEDKIDFFRLFLEFCLLFLICTNIYIDFIYLPSKGKIYIKKQNICRPSKIPDFVSYCCFFINVILWIIYVTQVYTNSGISDTSRDYEASFESTNPVFANLQIFFIYTNTACLNIFILLVIMLREFKMTKALAVVSRSLSKAAVDLGYFCLILFLVYVIYAFIGFYYFATVDENFRTPIASLETLFLWILGEVDWDIIFDRRPGVGHLFAWSWTLFASFILLNMLVAIVLEAYIEVKEKHDNILHLENKAKRFEVIGPIKKWFKKKMYRRDEEKPEWIGNSSLHEVLKNGEAWRHWKYISVRELAEYTDWDPETMERISRRLSKPVRKLRKEKVPLEKMVTVLYKNQLKLMEQIERLERTLNGDNPSYESSE
eukprot:TRINITY_DN7542_c0_g1_i2.p1 TRINITY_DN7542_c0_g1~~TRINITY_DN7542_c0_g1_i2.p1  ORF type:complete len:667 (-),score=107.41 TRINITY_DN7542_c0_g1_i2:19-2019(-)